MADDNILRSYRSNDQARRPSAPAASRDVSGSDPLAELARLIGQSDPFADLERKGSPSTETRQRAEPAPGDWRKTAAALARESMRDPPVTDSRLEAFDSAIADARSLRAPPDDPFAHPTSYPPLSAHAHADVDRTALHQDGYVDSPYQDEPQFDDHIDDRLRASYQVAEHDHESDNYFFEGAEAPTDQDFYDDPPRARTTNGLVTAIVLVGCGILGTAGAYGYRTYYSIARPTDAPIISAEKAPSKMVPAPAGSDSQSGKSMERVGDSNERVVARQEEPMTLPDPNGPRVVLPAPFTTSPGPGPAVVQSNPPPSAAIQSNPPSAAATEPKKVHTVAIRPDGPDPMSRPVGIVGSPPLQTAPSPPTATTRQPSASRQPAPPPARNGGGPLSLEPQAQPSEMASSYQQPAAPQHPVSAPTSAPRLASVPAAASSGGYMVQVSSQRSEADAQESFRSLQSKFPAQLADREAVVRRADLGAQGIFYRAMVGPFGTSGDADQFCSSLKAAGGKCILQKN